MMRIEQSIIEAFLSSIGPDVVFLYLHKPIQGVEANIETGYHQYFVSGIGFSEDSVRLKLLEHEVPFTVDYDNIAAIAAPGTSIIIIESLPEVPVIEESIPFGATIH